MPFAVDDAVAMLGDFGVRVVLPGVYDGPGELTRIRRTTSGGDRSVVEYSLRVPGGAFGTPGPQRGTTVLVGEGEQQRPYRLQDPMESGDRDGAFDDWLLAWQAA